VLAAYRELCSTGSHHTHVATPYCPALDMKLFPRLTVGEAQHGDIRDCSNPEAWKVTSHPS
jgi:hypothetical protein